MYRSGTLRFFSYGRLRWCKVCFTTPRSCSVSRTIYLMSRRFKVPIFTTNVHLECHMFFSLVVVLFTRLVVWWSFIENELWNLRVDFHWLLPIDFLGCFPNGWFFIDWWCRVWRGDCLLIWISTNLPDLDGPEGVPFRIESGVGIESHGVLSVPISEFGSISWDIEHLSKVGFAIDWKLDVKKGHMKIYLYIILYSDSFTLLCLLVRSDTI